jgi:hypothetical protein
MQTSCALLCRNKPVDSMRGSGHRNPSGAAAWSALQATSAGVHLRRRHRQRHANARYNGNVRYCTSADPSLTLCSMCTATNADGHYILCGSEDCSTTIWDFSNATPTHDAVTHFCPISALVLVVLLPMQMVTTYSVDQKTAAPPSGTLPPLHPPPCRTLPSAMHPYTAWHGAAAFRQLWSAASVTMRLCVCWRLRETSHKLY